jgi:hypothetical protein
VTLKRISAGAAAGAGENGPISATANCPSGTTLLSGGYELSGGTDADIAQILDNRPATASSWTAAAGSVVGGPFILTVYANCLQAPFAVVTQIISAPVDVPVDGQYHDASAACPGDAQVSGGGFTSAEGVASGPQVNASLPLIGVGTSPHARAWDIQILRTQDPTPSTVYAVCVISPQMSEASVTARQAVSPTSGPLTVQCASGQLLIGGGFAMDTDGANVSGSALAPTGTQWTITASPFPFTGAPPSVNETAYAVCIMLPKN